MNLEFSYSEFYSGRFDTSGSMLSHLVPEISPLYAFCDIVVAVVVVVVVLVVGVLGIGDSRSWICFFGMQP